MGEKVCIGIGTYVSLIAIKISEIVYDYFEVAANKIKDVSRQCNMHLDVEQHLLAVWPTQLELNDISIMIQSLMKPVLMSLGHGLLVWYAPGPLPEQHTASDD